MRRKRLVPIGLALMVSSASASEWIQFAENGDAHIGNIISYDASSLVTTGVHRKLWLRLETVKRTDNQESKTGDISLQLWDLNCHERTYVVLRLFEDNIRHRRVDLSASISKDPEYIEPDSWTGLLLDKLCK